MFPLVRSLCFLPVFQPSTLQCSLAFLHLTLQYVVLFLFLVCFHWFAPCLSSCVATLCFLSLWLIFGFPWFFGFIGSFSFCLIKLAFCSWIPSACGVFLHLGPNLFSQNCNRLNFLLFFLQRPTSWPCTEQKRESGYWKQTPPPRTTTQRLQLFVSQPTHAWFTCPESWLCPLCSLPCQSITADMGLLRSGRGWQKHFLIWNTPVGVLPQSKHTHAPAGRDTMWVACRVNESSN